MLATSKSQQRYMDMLATGQITAPKGLSKKEAEKFAKTKHKGLPEKVNETTVSFKEYLLNQEL